MKALVFDTETTGLSENRTIKTDMQPEIIEFYGCLVELGDGTILEELEHLIRPNKALSDQPVDKRTSKSITDITGISNQLLADKPPFKAVADDIIGLLERAPLVISHNISFDKEVLDIEAARLGRIIKWPPCRCSVEQTVHLKGKRLTLSALHEHLLGEQFADAHRAKADVQALVRCCCKLHAMGEL